MPASRVSRDHVREFFLAFDGETYFYPTGHWFKIECQDQADTKSRPAGLKYSLKFFDADGNCLVRFDNSHPPHRRGRPRPAAFDHWHRQTARGEELVPYQFTAVEQLLADFFAAVDRYLPPELRSSG